MVGNNGKNGGGGEMGDVKLSNADVQDAFFFGVYQFVMLGNVIPEGSLHEEFCTTKEGI